MSIELASVAAFVAAVGGARSVDFAAYTLGSGITRDALLAAAQAGAHVRVRLERDPFADAAGGLQQANARVIDELARAGADAALTPPGAPMLHMKAALIDGVAWLDDRNWANAGPQTVVRDDDPADVVAVDAALRGVTAVPAGALRTTKAGAQELQVALIRTAGDQPVCLETESFGNGAVYSALLARARAGEPTRLLVAGREAAEPGPRGLREVRRLKRLAALGVAVRTSGSRGTELDEKLTVTPMAAWVGSANATYACGLAGDQRDWGMRTDQMPLVDGLRAAFERNWSQAKPLGDRAISQQRRLSSLSAGS